MVSKYLQLQCVSEVTIRYSRCFGREGLRITGLSKALFSVLITMLCMGGYAHAQFSETGTAVDGVQSNFVKAETILQRHTIELDNPRADVATSRNSAGRVIVSFREPNVKGWVSADYIEIDSLSNLAKINADVLNLRLGPRLDSPIITNISPRLTSTDTSFTPAI